MKATAIESNIDQKPFSDLIISDPELDLSFQTNIKKRQIKQRLCSFYSHPNEKAKYYYFVKQTQNLIKTTTNKKSLEPFKTIQIVNNQKPSIIKLSTIPKVILSYCDPYLYNFRKNNKNQENKDNYKYSSIQSAHSFRRSHINMKTEETNFEDDFPLYQRGYDYRENKKTELSAKSIQLNDSNVYFDSELIEKISKEKEKVNKKLDRLELNLRIKAEEDYYNNTSSYMSFHKKYYQLKEKKKHKARDTVIPREYRALSFKKKCIFNNEYDTIYTNRIKVKSHRLFVPPSLTINDNNISKRFSSISKNINTINRTMVQDKKYSQKAFKGEVRKRYWKDHPERGYINNEIHKAKFRPVELENKGSKEIVAVHVFEHLKEVLNVRTKKEQDSLAKTLDSTIIKFCKKENLGLFLRRKEKSNYKWRLKRNEEAHQKIKKTLQTIEDNDLKIKCIQRKIKAIDKEK